MTKELEALKCFDKIDNTINLNWQKGFLRVGIDVRNRSDCNDEKEMIECLNTIKQALLKAEKKNDKEIAFYLINTKDVDIKLLKCAYPDVEAYNVKVRAEKDYWWREELDGLYKYLPNEYYKAVNLWKPVYDEYIRIGYRLKYYPHEKGVQLNLEDFMEE